MAAILSWQTFIIYIVNPRMCPYPVAVIWRDWHQAPVSI